MGMCSFVVVVKVSVEHMVSHAFVVRRHGNTLMIYVVKDVEIMGRLTCVRFDTRESVEGFVYLMIVEKVASVIPFQEEDEFSRIEVTEKK